MMWLTMETIMMLIKVKTRGAEIASGFGNPQHIMQLLLEIQYQLVQRNYCLWLLVVLMVVLLH